MQYDADFFAVIDDSQAGSPEPVPFCRDGAGNPLICYEKEDALWIRDKHREQHEIDAWSEGSGMENVEAGA